MNVEIGTEAALFPEKEYISGIFAAVLSALLVHLSILLIFSYDSPVTIVRLFDYRISANKCAEVSAIPMTNSK
jgi:hypothetical protein